MNGFLYFVIGRYICLKTLKDEVLGLLLKVDWVEFFVGGGREGEMQASSILVLF